MRAEGNGLLVGVINNAGYSVSGRLEAVPLGKWKKEYDGTPSSALHVVRAAHAHIVVIVIVMVIVVVVVVVVVAVNVFGVVAVTQAFLPLLKSAAKQGASPRVVFVSSVVGSAAMAETAPYSSSKFAVQAIAVCAHLTLHRTTHNAARCGMLTWHACVF